MKVSVVIPMYNEEKYISLCLDSVLNQEEMPDEVIVVDNNSKDRCVAIASRFPVTVINEKKQGMIPARNAGFNAAQYEIIARCDADTRVPTDWIKLIKENVIKGKADAVSGPLFYDDLPLLKKQSIRMTKFHAKTFNRIKHHDVLLGPNMALTKEMWLKVKDHVRLDDKKVHEDHDLAMQVAKAGGKIRFDPTLIVATSSRRIKKNPASFFIEYPIRLVQTMRSDDPDIESTFKRMYRSFLLQEIEK